MALPSTGTPAERNPVEPPKWRVRASSKNEGTEVEEEGPIPKHYMEIPVVIWQGMGEVLR